MDRKSLINRIASQYLGRGEEDEDLPWMEYVQKKNTPAKGLKDTVDMVGDMVEHSTGIQNPGTADGQLGKNLLDGVQDALSIPHEQDYQPSNENDNLGQGAGNLIPAEFNWSNREDVPDESLRLFYKNKHRQDDATGNPWGSDLYGKDLPGYMKEGRAKKAFKNIHEVIENSSHPRSIKVKEKGQLLNPRNVTTDSEKSQGIFTFNVDGKDGEHTVVLQLLKAEGKDNLTEHPCLLACDCQDFLYGGPQYYAIKGKYMYMPMMRPSLKEPRDPAQGGRGKGLTYCKHISAVASHLTELGVDKDYSEDIQKALLDISDRDDFFRVVEDGVLDSKARFIQFVLDERLHKEILDLGRKELRERGLNEHQMFDYVQGTFSESNERVQKMVLKNLADNPGMIIMILLEYKKAMGTVPEGLYSTAYDIIKQHIE
jgi:hypothetical protein